MTSVLLLAAAVTMAQAPPPANAVVETSHLTVTTSAGTAGAGARVPLYVDIAMKPKMHVYAPGEKDAIPVTLTLTPDETIKVTPAEFPAPERYDFEPIKLTQLVYSKPFRITQFVTVAAPASRSAGAARVVKGVLRYQACDDKVCYVPKSVPVSWTLPVR